LILVRARADAGLPVGLAALARQDGQVVVAEMNGKSALPASRVKTTVCLPSALMSVTGATIGLAADVDARRGDG